ncbi:MAG: hypothetical protein LAP21_05605 [Acidobacteriia bacterium]|nr:hypothetical protein [Terriglobia bacterium]
MTHTLYLKSYDLYDEILEYHLPDGKFAILPREKFVSLGIPLTFGAFCREGRQVAGIFASPEGPVFFRDAQHVVGRFGATSATVKDVPAQTKRYFAFSHKQEPSQTVEFGLLYEKRLGLGANPYDNEEEDIDLLAMIASNVGHEAFFRAYIKDWVGGSEQQNPTKVSPGR